MLPGQLAGLSVQRLYNHSHALQRDHLNFRLSRSWHGVCGRIFLLRNPKSRLAAGRRSPIGGVVTFG